MCTAILSVLPGAPTLLAGVRDELTARDWLPPARHWPEFPALIGGRDLQAGGTWLALDPGGRRAGCVLNGRGVAAPAAARRSRGTLPLRAAAGLDPVAHGLTAYDPFHLLRVEPASATMWSWDGDRLTRRELAAGLHMVVNGGLDSDLIKAGHRGPGRAAPSGDAVGRRHELARIEHFLPRLRAAVRPGPRPADTVADAWGGWLPLLAGDGIPAADAAALIVRHDLGDGRVYGTTSISLVALAADGVRYDFTGSPGDPAAWYPVPLPQPVGW